MSPSRTQIDATARIMQQRLVGLVDERPYTFHQAALDAAVDVTGKRHAGDIEDAYQLGDAVIDAICAAAGQTDTGERETTPDWIATVGQARSLFDRMFGPVRTIPLDDDRALERQFRSMIDAGEDA